MNIGAHVSAAGGLFNTISRGEAIGANVVQSFASSPRSVKFTPYADEIIEKYLNLRKESSVVTHVFHGVYLINLAHEKPDYVDVCVQSLEYYQQLLGRIRGYGTVFHIGSHKGKGLEAVIDQVGSALVRVLSSTPQDVKLMLENAAGHKGTIGQQLSELRIVYETVIKMGGDISKLGYCLDTQHAFASGYDLTTLEGVQNFYEEVERELGIENVWTVHVNDSATELGSKRDRHANIGEGHIGPEGIGHFMDVFGGLEIPFILEVPGAEKSGPRKIDVEMLKSLAHT